MAVVPPDPWAILGFAIAIGGTVALVVSDWPKAYGLAALIVLAFGVEAVGGYVAVITQLGFSTQGFLAGYWWTPFTYMYMHADVLHVFGNLLILVSAGPMLEERYGEWRFLAIYFAAGFAAVGAQVVLEPLGVIDPGIAIGASGAIFGILTTFAMRHPKDRLPFTAGFFILWLPAFLVLLIHLGFNLAIMAVNTGGIAWYGHFAGYLVGLAAAPFVKAPATVAKHSLPNVDALRPLATDRDQQEMLDKAAAFTGDDKNDATFALAWVEKFVARAECPTHHVPLEEDARVVRCPRGDVEVRY